MIRTKWALVAPVVFSVLFTTAQNVYSAGFAIIEQSVSGLGNAFAGGSASTNDASAMYYNPASMMQLEGKPLNFGLHAISPSIKFTNNDSTRGIGGFSTGGNGGDAGVTGVVPNFYFVMDVDENTKFGIGINAPFGLATSYENDWVGRYQSVDSEIQTVNINPSLAFNMTPSLSFGLGFSLQYINAELTNAVDLGTVCFGMAADADIPVSAADCVTGGLTPGDVGSDGYAKVSGDSWSMGYNLGFLYALDQNTNISVAYRSKVKQSLGGDADFTLSEGAQGIDVMNLVFADTGVSANVTLPETASFSGSHKISDKWKIMADVTFTKWSRFSELVLEFDNPNKPKTVEENRWEDSMRFSVGADWIVIPVLTLRTGLAYDEGASQDKVYRSPRVPDSDRTWLALGLTYRITQKASLDAGYAHLFLSNSDIERTNSGTGDTLIGSYESSVDILSAAFNWVF